MNSWIGALSTFGQGLRYGGAQAVIFSLLAATAVQWILTLGLAELASAFPSSGVGIINHTMHHLHPVDQDQR
jgi:choline transport protein